VSKATLSPNKIGLRTAERIRSGAETHNVVQLSRQTGSSEMRESAEMNQGNVVLLNGTSSAGKSSIAQALQEVI
jgi:tRNA A37 threonylcarbamoyladenosine biosynthesis protein TsaE